MSLFVIIDGCLWARGDNTCGQLGFGDHKSRDEFEAVPIEKCLTVSCGQNHIMVLNTQGQIWAVGSNHCGQLGLSQEKRVCELSLVPSPLIDQKFISVSCGDYHTLALDGQLNVWACGSNTSGELGLSNVNEAIPIFTKVPLENVTTLMNQPRTKTGLMTKRAHKS